MKYHESKFSVENYEEFYTDHIFKPVSLENSVKAHRLVPRVGWGLDIAKEVNAKRILDLGCLDGFNLLTLTHHLPNAIGVGVDLSSQGIELGRERAAHFNLPIEFIQSSIEDFLLTTKDKYDLICFYEVIEHVKDVQLILNLIKNVMTDKGTLLVSTPSFESPIYGKNDVVNKCHIRLYTTKDENYSEMTDLPDPDTGKVYLREATSLTNELKDFRIISMDVFSELIHARATKE